MAEILNNPWAFGFALVIALVLLNALSYLLGATASAIRRGRWRGQTPDLFDRLGTFSVVLLMAAAVLYVLRLQ